MHAIMSTAAAYQDTVMRYRTPHPTTSPALPVPLVMTRMPSLVTLAMGARQGRMQRVWAKLRAHYVLLASTLTSLTHPLPMIARLAGVGSTLPPLGPMIVGPVLLAPFAHSLE